MVALGKRPSPRRTRRARREKNDVELSEDNNIKLSSTCLCRCFSHNSYVVLLRALRVLRGEPLLGASPKLVWGCVVGVPRALGACPTCRGDACVAPTSWVAPSNLFGGVLWGCRAPLVPARLVGATDSSHRACVVGARRAVPFVSAPPFRGEPLSSATLKLVWGCVVGVPRVRDRAQRHVPLARGRVPLIAHCSSAAELCSSRAGSRGFSAVPCVSRNLSRRPGTLKLTRTSTPSPVILASSN